MIKANAYGHGDEILVRALSDMGIAFWGVACVEEAARLVSMGVTEPVLVVQPAGGYEPDDAVRERLEFMVAHGIRVTVAEDRGLDLLAAVAARCDKKAFVHIKIDTGMGRNGCSHEEAELLILRAAGTPGISLEGIYSHFACADEENPDFSHEQMAVFQAVSDRVASRGVRVSVRHMANSAAIFNLPPSWMDMIRPGLALYGYGGEHIRGCEKLMPSLRMVAPVLMTKIIRKGRSCGYGATFVAGRDTRAGLLPLGYADGYSRRLSNAGIVEIEGRPVPVIGRVSMDLVTVDLTDVPGAEAGTDVCVIGNRREAANSVESIAQQLGTIPHEVTAMLGARVERVMVE